MVGGSDRFSQTGAGTASRNPVQHSLRAQVLVDVRPMYALPIADECVMSALGRCRLGKPPGPHKRYADDPSIDEIGGDHLISDLDTLDSRFSRYRSAHARPH